MYCVKIYKNLSGNLYNPILALFSLYNILRTSKNAIGQATLGCSPHQPQWSHFPLPSSQGLLLRSHLHPGSAGASLPSGSSSCRKFPALQLITQPASLLSAYLAHSPAHSGCYRLNCVPLDPYVGALTPTWLLLGIRFLGKQLRLNEVIRVGP